MVPVLPAKSTTNNNNSFLDRLHRVEKHLRKNKLKLTLTERLGAAHEADDVSSQAEAKKLAFYLFWNCKSSFERYSCLLPLQHILPCYEATMKHAVVAEHAASRCVLLSPSASALAMSTRVLHHSKDAWCYGYAALLWSWRIFKCFCLRNRLEIAWMHLIATPMVT